MTNLESFKNLYEVRRTVRFSLLKQNYKDFFKCEENALKDVPFLNTLLWYEWQIVKIQKKTGIKAITGFVK